MSGCPVEAESVGFSWQTIAKLQGEIGTNKSDAAAVVELMIADMKSPKNAGDIADLLTHQLVVDQSAWQKINEAEVAAGEPKGKPRVKSVKWDELLKLGLT
mgnify:CR=1 FL=1